MRTNRFYWLTAGILMLHAALLAQVMDRGMGQFLDVEEGFVAFTADALRTHSANSWSLYLHTEYRLSTLLLGALTIPSFALFGETVLALKLVSVLISLLTLLLVILLAERMFGRGTALITGILLALAPPPWLIRGIQTMGDTSEAMLFAIAQWLLLTALEKDQPVGAQRWRAAALGLVTGLGLTFNLSLIASTAAVLLYWMSTRGREQWPLLLLAVVGCLAGLALPIYNLLFHDVRFYVWRGQGLQHMLDDLAGSWRALTGIFSIETRNGFYLGLAVDRLASPQIIWIHHIYWGASLTAWLWCGAMSRGQPRSGERKLFLLFGIHLLAYLLNRHRVPYLLLMLVPVGAMCLGRMLSWIGGKSDGRSVRWPLTGLLTSAFCAAQLLPLCALMTYPRGQPIYQMSVVDHDRWAWRLKPFGVDWVVPLENRADVPVIPGASAFGTGLWLAHRSYPDDAAYWLAQAQTAKTAVGILRGYGYGAAWNDPSSATLRRLAASEPKTLSLVTLSGFGHCLAERYWGDLDGQLRQAGHDLPWAARRMLYQGLGYGLGRRFCHTPQRFATILRQVPTPWWPSFLEGLQARVQLEVSPGPKRTELLGLIVQTRSDRRTIPEGAEPIELGSPAGAIQVKKNGVYRLWVKLESTAQAGISALADGHIAVPLTLAPPTRRRWLGLGRLELTQGTHQLGIWASHGNPEIHGVLLTFD